MKWTTALDRRLIRLWEKNVTTTLIAAALTKSEENEELVKITKNMVIGRAHRLHLAPRQLPISLARAKYKLRMRNAKPAPVPTPPPRDPRRGCQWIDEVDPATLIERGDDQYCGKPRVNSSAYCIEHHERATLRRPPDDIEVDDLL